MAFSTRTQRLHFRALGFPLLGGLLFAGGCGNSTEPPPRNGAFSYADPAGDDRDIAGTPVRHDLRRVSGYVDSDTLVLTLSFAGEVEPGMYVSYREIMGLIHFDVDEDPETGDISFEGWSYVFPGLGADFGLNLRTMRLHPMGDDQSPGTPIRTEWPGRSVTLYIPLELFGPDDGEINIAGVVSPPVAAFDEFPNEGFYELRWTPEP